jgi:hypothetical protein
MGDEPVGLFHEFDCCGRVLRVHITSRLRRIARKAGVWGSKAMLGALKNAMYGFDPARPRSRGGADGIFLVDRKHRPRNAMMKKLFDGFLDLSEDAGEKLAAEIGVEGADPLPVRLVSHDMRLLGLLFKGETGDDLVLVDFDCGG